MSNSIGRSTLHLWQDITMGWNIFWMHNLKFLCICVLMRIYEKICSNHLVNTAGHQNGILFFCRCCLGWHSFGQPHEPIIFLLSCICLVLCGHFTINCSLAESFYYLNNGLSIIASKISQIIWVLNENINIGASVVFKTKCELKCLNELFLKYHFSGNTSFYVFIIEIVSWTLD